MQTSPSIDLLNRLLDDTVNSVVQYAEIGAPYVPAGFDEQMKEIRRISDEEKQLATEIVEVIQSRDCVPAVGVFKFWNVDLNDLDIRFMARFAVEKETEAIDHLEAGLDSVADDPQVHGIARRAIEQKREHLAKLTEIASDY